MAVSTAITRSIRAAPVSFSAGVLASAATLGGAEAIYRLSGAFWGAVGFAAIALVMVQLAVLAGIRGAVHSHMPALLAVASLVPLTRLLMLGVPAVSFLRLNPNALWVLPLIIASVYAYRAHWIPGARPHVLHLPSPGWPSLEIQAAVVAVGALLGVLGAYIVPYAGPHVLSHQDAAKWTGAVLFALAGAAEELAWRGILQGLMADVAGCMGVMACFVLSAYVTVAWMGWNSVAPVILSVVTTVVVCRTRFVTGSVTAHSLLNFLLVVLR
ncbi:MAG: CPBP family glutamic-type intramembrane protease [Ktedonobacterales bacterium]